MFETLFKSEELIGSVSVSPNNEFELTKEKVAANPRSISSEELKNAINNVQYEYEVEDNVIKKSIKYVLTELFFNFHQKGLYNRQFKFWKSISTITLVSVKKLKEGLLKKEEMNLYLCDFMPYEESKSFTSIVDLNNNLEFNSFKSVVDYLINSRDDIKGLIYFTFADLSEEFIKKLDKLTASEDLISRYESRIKNSKNARLNIVKVAEVEGKTSFKHLYPIN